MSKQSYSVQEGLGYLGEDLLIQGTVHSEKKIVVSCTVEGSLHGDQEIIVSEKGNVNGKIEGNIVVVAGKINVRRGQKLRRGDLLGLVGSTGRSTGPHLHYEIIINGRRTNPLIPISKFNPDQRLYLR